MREIIERTLEVGRAMEMDRARGDALRVFRGGNVPSDSAAAGELPTRGASGRSSLDRYSRASLTRETLRIARGAPTRGHCLLPEGTSKKAA